MRLETLNCVNCSRWNPKRSAKYEHGATETSCRVSSSAPWPPRPKPRVPSGWIEGFSGILRGQRVPSTVVGGFGSRCTSSLGSMGHSGIRTWHVATALVHGRHIQSAVWPCCLPLREHFSVPKVFFVVLSHDTAVAVRLFSVSRPRPSLSPLFSLLSVWPSSRPSWPPPGSLR